MSYALFRFLAFSLTHTHLHTKVLLQTANTSMYVSTYVKKLSGSGMCIRTYASGTYRQQYASSLNHPSSDINSAAEKERKKEEEQREVEKKKKKTMPSRRIKSLEKKLGFYMSVLYLEGTCKCILYTVLYLIAMT